jgi:hypothetical protein
MDAGVVSGLLQSVMQDNSGRRRVRSLKGDASNRPSTRRLRRLTPFFSSLLVVRRGQIR